MEITGLENLRSHLLGNNPLTLNGQPLLGDYTSQTLTAMANDVLSAGRDTVKKIRDSIEFVKTSEKHEEKFSEFKQQLLQVPSNEVSLLLLDDDETQWKTTYQMLASALAMKEVFSCLDTAIPEYKEAPTMEEWKQVQTICAHLKSLFDALNFVTISSHCPPAITMFQEALRIHGQIARAAATSGCDPFVKPMQEKMEKYWKECGVVLAVSAVMDPRYKMQLVEFAFPKIFNEESSRYVKMVNDGVHELFVECKALYPPPSPSHGGDDHDQGWNNVPEYGLADFDMYIMENPNQELKSELDRYLDANLVARNSDLDVLGWWKQNRRRYPTVSKMAMDILSIPVSTTAWPESV